MTWSRYKPEYMPERRKLNAIGLERYCNKIDQSYKEQALRELVMRHYLEDKIEDMRQELNRRQDKIELLEEEVWKLKS